MGAARLLAPLGVVLVAAQLAVAQVPAPPAAPPTDRKTELLRRLLGTIEAGAAPYFGRATLEDLKKKAAALPSGAPQAQVFGVRLALGATRLSAGEVQEAIDDLTQCEKIARERDDVRGRLVALKWLGIAWMRYGERANCIRQHNRDSCLLPLKGGALHTDRKGSEEAIRVLDDLLAIDGHDYAALWLLNVAHMTLGSWPDGVPAKFRIPPSAFASERELPRMVDVAPELGLAATNHAGGSALDDFDGDGRLDVVTSGLDPREPLRLFRQQPDGTFREAGPEAGLSGQVCALNFIHFDANNDGRLDLLVQRGAWMHDFGRLPNSLLLQQPDGSFVDRTLEAGLEIAAPSQVAAAADIDRDGDLDVFLGYESWSGDEKFPCRLFRNRGDATFEEITERAGVRNDGYCKGANFGDYDGDGLPDLYVSNLSGWNRLYHNDGDGKFHDVATELGVADPYDSFSCFFLDYDNDGWLDLFVAGYQQDDRAGDVGAWFKNGTTGHDTQRLYRNDGKGGFDDVTAECGLRRTCFPMGSNFGDIDEDGFPDLYLCTGEPELGSIWPNVMLHNGPRDESKPFGPARRFEDVTTATGTGHLQKGHGASFGDFDGDGDQDLFEELGGVLKDDAFHDALFLNPGHGRHWITVRLVGKESNRFGVGARIRASIEAPSGARDVYAFVGGNSSFGGNSLQAEIGLGDATKLAALEVRWPAGGDVQRLTDVPLDRAIVVEERGGWREVPAPAGRTPAGGAAK